MLAGGARLDTRLRVHRPRVTKRAAAFLLGALLGLAGCSRSGGPSPEYAQAREEFNALYGRLLDDAYVSPQMATVEAKLERVPEQSEDHSRAQELLQRIRSERERIQMQIAEREAAVKGAVQATDDFQFARAGEEDAGAPDAGARDAGTSDQPAAGMPLAELRRRFGMCFDPGTELELPGKGNRPTFVLRNMAVCRERHPGFDRRLVVAEGDRVLFIADQKDVEIVGGDAGVSPSQNAGPLTEGERSAGARR
jgi:hypothetical protein